MAEIPSNVRWPPGNYFDFDKFYERLQAIKTENFPEHTVRDLADPFNQIISLVAAVAQYAAGKANQGFLNLSPRTAYSRAALISQMEINNRPLRPIIPSRGEAYAKVIGTPAAATVLTDATQKLAKTNSLDPIFSSDEEVVFPVSGELVTYHYDDSAETATSLPDGAGSIQFGLDDYLLIECDTLAFDGMTITLATPMAGACLLSFEYRNFEYGDVDSVENLGSTLKFVLDSYLHTDAGTEFAERLEVTIRHRPTGVAEVVDTEQDGTFVYAVTSFLGQTSPSDSPSDYEVLAAWRPIPEVVDGTAGMSQTGNVTWSISSVLSETDRWQADPDTGYFSVRVRMTDADGQPNPSAIILESVELNGERYVVVGVTQGIRQTSTIGQVDGSAFQFLTLSSDPIWEPVVIPSVTITVGDDTEWTVVPDFSNSDSGSKHAVINEDPDNGWGLVFGDGGVGMLPTDGDSVKLTYRTGSVEPGDTDPDDAIRSIGGPAKLNSWKFYRGTAGYQAPEASDRASALRFRYAVVPQLALRTESAITAAEIVAALTGGAPNRATFRTDDGRLPFSRAFFTLEGAGTRQYRVVVVGEESVASGAPQSTDLDEAAEWLNGTTVGTQIVYGRGPNNTEAVVSGFTPRYLLPTVTITIANTVGIREQAELVIRKLLKPHARDEDENFRWKFGGRVPIPILFSELWAAIPKRVFIDITVADGPATLAVGDTITLDTTELPVLDPSFDPDAHIVLVVG